MNSSDAAKPGLCKFTILTVSHNPYPSAFFPKEFTVTVLPSQLIACRRLIASQHTGLAVEISRSVFPGRRIPGCVFFVLRFFLYDLGTPVVFWADRKNDPTRLVHA